MAEMVSPGDVLGVSEEYAAGEGTFEDGGKIYSLFLGGLERDERQRKLAVRGRKVVRPLKEGDLVYGVVHHLYEMMTMVRFAPAQAGSERPANGDTAFIKISELQQGYVEKLRDCVRTGDAVKARVLDIAPLATYLTMKERDLGVIGALCSNCRKQMAFNGREFQCGACGSQEPRKTPFAPSQYGYGAEGSEGGDREGGYGRSRVREQRDSYRGPRGRGGFGGSDRGGTGGGFGRGDGGSERSGGKRGGGVTSGVGGRDSGSRDGGSGTGGRRGGFRRYE